MDKIQLIALYVIDAALIALFAIERNYAFNRFTGIAVYVLLALFCTYEIVSAVNIFNSHKLIKRQENEKLKKSAILLKFGAVPFWIVFLFLFPSINVLNTGNFIFLITAYILLLGTSIHSISYMRLLRKKNEMSAGQTVVHVIFQLIFVFDILDMAYIKYSKRDGKLNVKNFAHFFLGSYKPPEFFSIIAEAFKRGPVPQAAVKVAAFFSEQWQNHKWRIFAVLAGIVVLIGAFAGYNFYQSRKPQPIIVKFAVQAPDTTGVPEPRWLLSVTFHGSAATLEMMDKEVPPENITINPHIEGSWQWQGDSVLVFKTEQTWRVGKRYTVTFAKDFFPSHIKVDKSFSFDIEDFKLNVVESEFYIDPEDSFVKRVLVTLSTNYPVDASTLESKISVEPNITADSGQLAKRQYQFTVSYNETRTFAYIVSEPLGMPAKPVQMRIQIAQGVTDSSGDGRTSQRETVSVEIPGMTSYVHIRNMSHELIKNDSQLYDQILLMNTQGNIDPDELVKNIEAWVLPVDKPDLPGIRGQRNYSWGNLQDIVPQVLSLSEKVRLDALPNELKYSSFNSWKFDVEPGRYVYVKLNEGARFYGGYVLGESYEAIFRVKNFPRELAILSEGSILSFTGDKRLAMLSRGVDEVEFNIGRIRPDDINHLVSQTMGDVSNINFRNYNFSQYNITEQYTESAFVPVQSERDIAYFSFDFSRYLENIPDRNLRHGFFIFTVRAKRGSYSDQRLIMVTDLGFFVKTNSDSSKDIFVQSIASGNPVAAAAVNVLGLNGNTILSTYTDSGGRARIPAFPNDEYRNDRAPTVYTIRSGEDMSFMAYNSNGRMLDYSSFNVGGVQGVSDPKTLSAFLFSDRGIYRPGDEARIGIVIKSGDWAADLGGTPLECTVADPRGTEIYNRRIMLSPEGVEEIRFSTHDWSPTGTYITSVYVIQEYRQGNELRERRIFLGSQTVRVEEFLPDTLNVSAIFDPMPQEGWIAPSQLKAIVTVRNLFGTFAAGNEVKAQINLSPGYQYFQQYRDYKFGDPYQDKKSYEEFLGTKNTTDEGAAEFTMNLSKFEKASYRLSFYTEAFEKGSGRNVSAEAAVYISPLPYLIGYKADGSLSYIQRDTVRTLSFIAINPEAERTSADNLTLNIFELRYVSALVRQPNGVYKYQSIQKEYPISSQQITISAAGFEYRLSSDNPGDYRISINGPDDLEYSSVNFTIAGTGNIQRSLNRTAELEISLNKSDFRAGEEIELMIKAPYAGAGLITIERDRVYAYRWFISSGETSIQKITVPAEIEGNGYVNVHYLRSQDSPEIFMSPLSYGAVPFSISLENRTNQITLDIPDEAKPGEEFVIKYSSARQGKIIVYAVDEGILQLARYQTPDPLAFFFRKRALEVRTAQILDMVLPRYSIVQSLAAMGGGSGAEELSRNLNPFKRKQNVPVAYWSGIVDSGTEVRELRYRVPDYFNGTLRVMAVSVSNSAVGAQEERSLIRSTFIISPNTPMMAAPGDEFEITVTVTNNQKGSGENGRVRLRAVPSAHFSVTGNSEFDLQIPEGRDQTLRIPVKAAGPLGAAQIRFIASNNGESSELSAYMSVRPAVPYRVSLYSGAVKNKSVDVTIDRNIYEEFSTRDISLSYLPMGMAKGLSFYLNAFPYGCSEQITSAVFPFLYPQLFKELGFTKTEADEGINRVIGILQARMKENGAVGMWTSRSYDDPIITIYSAHFFTEARNAGYYVSPAVMDKILGACRSIGSGSGKSLLELTNRSYAIYILTLNEIITTTLIEGLKKDMSGNAEAETGFAGLYLAGSYALLQKTSDASTLLGKVKRTIAKDNIPRFTDELMYHALYLNIVSRHFPQRLRDISESLLLDMASQMERQFYTTISANYALMAVNSYLKAVPSAQNGSFVVQEILKNSQRRQLVPAVTSPGGALMGVPFSADAEKISLENKDALNLFYQITAAGFDLEVPKVEIKNGIEVYREFLDDAGRPVRSIKTGDVVTVKLNFRSLTDRTYYDVAIVDLTPAGLEIEIDSIRQAPFDEKSWTADYVDIREDRVVIYGTVRNRISSFSYRARAINAGNFIAPSLFAEAMYDKSVWALRPQDPIRITNGQ